MCDVSSYLSKIDFCFNATWNANKQQLAFYCEALNVAGKV